MMAGLVVAIGGVTTMLISSSEIEPQPVPEDEAPSLAENVAEFATPLLDRDTDPPSVDDGRSGGAPCTASARGPQLPLLVVAVIVAMFFFGRSVRATSKPPTHRMSPWHLGIPKRKATRATPRRLLGAEYARRASDAAELPLALP